MRLWNLIWKNSWQSGTVCDEWTAGNKIRQVRIIIEAKEETRRYLVSKYFTEKELYELVSPLIQAKGENARTIKIKIQQAIENMMFTKVENSQNGGD